eukprot:9287367-Ditylum_brightwellii.AAC.2
MKNVERHNHLDDGQYRERQGRMSINPVVIKVLSLEISYFQRSNMGMTDCDAKAYYNHIILVIAVLLERKAGVPANAGTLFARALKDIQYHMGSGQGACDSPAKLGTHKQRNHQMPQ